MNIFDVTFFAALVAAGAGGLLLGAEEAPEASPGSITREWTWSDGATTTNFTAEGPAEQVNGLDPRVSPLDCEGCLLTSSTRATPEREAALTDVVDESRAGG